MDGPAMMPRRGRRRAISSTARARGSPSTCRRRCTDPLDHGVSARRSRSRSGRCGTRPACRRRAPAAVLVPVVDHAEPSVLLTMRTSDLPSHAGQIAFPGGKIDPTMRRRSPPRCARPRRRSGSTRALIDPIGYLDLYLTFSGFRILPVVARVVPNYALTHQRLRGRRRLRGAARLPDGRRRTTRATAATGRASRGTITRCRSASAISGA